jgi:asparagine synthase (glutamine-hydrolysing)
MCGIGGIVFKDKQKRPDDCVLTRMRETLHHRGPDDCGVHVEAGVGFVHRRLSIIDLAGSRQPISNEDQTVQLVYNGEIYNYRELRDWLRDKGHTLRTSGDSEVLVHLWEE